MLVPVVFSCYMFVSIFAAGCCGFDIWGYLSSWGSHCGLLVMAIPTQAEIETRVVNDESCLHTATNARL